MRFTGRNGPRLEGFEMIAIERENEYFPLIMFRLGRIEGIQEAS